MKDFPTDDLQKRECATIAECIGKAWTGLLQGKSQGQRTERANDISGHEIPNRLLSSGISRELELDGRPRTCSDKSRHTHRHHCRPHALICQRCCVCRGRCAPIVLLAQLPLHAARQLVLRWGLIALFLAGRQRLFEFLSRLYRELTMKSFDFPRFRRNVFCPRSSLFHASVPGCSHAGVLTPSRTSSASCSF